MGREEKWINIAKVVAILAVLTDQTYMVLYDNDLILLGSFFSVSLFMLLSGYTFVIAAEKKRNFTLWQLTKKNLTKIMIPYVGATFIYFIIDTHSFVFDEFLNRLFHFNMSIPFYYVLLYFQVMLVAPFLYGAAVLGKRKGYIHLITLGLLFLFSVFANNMTNIMDIYGGGGVLAGGSYLILFYLGMLLKMYAKQLRKLSSLIGCVLSGFMLVLWYRFEFTDRFALDQKLRLGNGLNPPGITGIILACLIALTIFYLTDLFEKMQNRVINMGFKLCSVLGRSTLYIFLYHRLFMDYWLGRYCSFSNIWTKRVVYFGVMILGSLCIKKLLLLIRQIVKGMYCQQCGSLENAADKADNIDCESVQLDVRE